MPLSPIAEFLLQPLFEVILYVFGYLTGYVVVPVISLGTYRVEKLDENQRPRPRLGKRSNSPPDSKMLSADAGTAIGIVTWFVFAIAIYLLWTKAT